MEGLSATVCWVSSFPNDYIGHSTIIKSGFCHKNPQFNRLFKYSLGVFISCCQNEEHNCLKVIYLIYLLGLFDSNHRKTWFSYLLKFMRFITCICYFKKCLRTGCDSQLAHAQTTSPAFRFWHKPKNQALHLCCRTETTLLNKHVNNCWDGAEHLTLCVCKLWYPRYRRLSVQMHAALHSPSGTQQDHRGLNLWTPLQ